MTRHPRHRLRINLGCSTTLKIVIYQRLMLMLSGVLRLQMSPMAAAVKMTLAAISRRENSTDQVPGLGES